MFPWMMQMQGMMPGNPMMMAQQARMPSGDYSSDQSMASSSLQGKTEEERQRAIVVKALKEIADTDKKQEKSRLGTLEDDGGNKPSKTSDDKDKKPRCFLHAKPNKNCKKCQASLESQSSSKEPSEDKQKEALDADEIMRRNTNKSRDDSEKRSLQCSPMLKEQIVKSSYFKSLMEITSVHGLIEEIVEYVDTLDVYNQNNKTNPSCFISHVFRLSVLAHIENELGLLIDNRDYPVVRCVGFLYIRFVTPANELWDTLEEYLLDDMELTYSQDGAEITTTIGEYVESLLISDKYFDSPLPRLPVKVRQLMEEKVAPMLQHRKRMEANRRAITPESVSDTPVEVNMDGTWLRGTAKELSSNVPSRVKLKVRLEGGVDVKVHLGRVVIVDRDDENDQDDRRRRGRSRSRSRGRGGQNRWDWSREKGKTDAEMLQELRERSKEHAVCGHGKSYAKRPVNFEGSMASTALQNPDAGGMTSAGSAHRGGGGGSRHRHVEEEAAVDQEIARRKRDEDAERQRRLAAVYKKYTAAPTQSSGSAYKEVDTPDVLRLG